jgi:hypothetical protein
MALIRTIHNWLNRHISALNCAVNGHGDIKIIEEYEHGRSAQKITEGAAWII